MARAVGIDLGTTNSAVAVIEGGQPRILVNAEGGRTTPSVVAFKGDERLVGNLARRQAALNPAATIASVKRFMGRTVREVEADAAASSATIAAGPNDAARFVVDGRLVAPEEVSAVLLRKLVHDASQVLGERVTQAVVAVPAYFDDAQRQATRDAARIAGLEVLRLVNEPTAAALAYGLDHRRIETVLVFDLGGGTFDVSVLEVGDGLCEVRAAAGDAHLGGDDFDRRVVAWLLEEYERAHGAALPREPQSLARLAEAAERAKIELSSAMETAVHLPFLHADAGGPRHLEARLTRARFDAMTEDLVARCRTAVEEALSDARVAPGDVDEVILVGGSTRIPAVQRFVKRLLGGREPNLSVNPDEVVALGAAVQAGLIEGSVRGVLLLDVTPLSLGVETQGGLMTRIIPRNTTLPARRKELFTTAEDGQSSIDVVVLQGERPLAGDNRPLGRFRLDGLRPGPRGEAQVEVTFEIDSSGLLAVSARDMESGAARDVTISGATALAPEEVERLVGDAESNATDDRARRAEIELRNRLEALAHHVGGAVADEAGSRLAPADRAAAERLVADARAALSARRRGDELRPLARDLESIARLMA